MMPYESLDISPEAIEKVSLIAVELGRTERQPVCGELGAQLFIAARHLLRIWPEQEDDERKLLRDIEKICSYPERPEAGLPRLRALAQAVPNTIAYKSIEQNIQNSMIAILEDWGKEVISHIQKYTESTGVRKLTTSDPYTPPKSTAMENPTETKALVYDILRKHVFCTCNPETLKEFPETLSEKRHLTKLLLRTVLLDDEDGNLQFDMLFSSNPLRGESTFGRWQDVEVLVPRAQKTSKSTVKWVGVPGNDNNAAHSRMCERFEEINRGKLCDFISQEVEARLRLRIQNNQLQRSLDSKPLQQIVEHTQGVALATVLRDYHLTAKMKAMLAYILAQSAWVLYDSDWMEVHWTSETIHFMRQYNRIQGEGESQIFPMNPYFSVRFSDGNENGREATDTVGEIHRYPRVRALGIMLVEIGLGSLLSSADNEHTELSQTLKANRTWARAKKYSASKDPWPNFDYGNYRRAVENCLNPGIFNDAPFDPNASDDIELASGLIRRRKIFHDQVVSPLEELVHGTGWRNDLHRIGPLKSHIAVQEKAVSSEANISEIPQILDTTRPILSTDRKRSQKWLKDIDTLNKHLSSLPGTIPQGRIRIAILDTGYDANSAFFQHNIRRNRLVKWRDWVENSTSPQDCHGHGTHLVALLMRIAPEAEICVARVAENLQDLKNAITNISEAIEWAQSECEADVISMSFGFTKEQKSISRAIYDAVKYKSILFFAAAANSGANERELFPARHECVISIRGTNGNGQFQDFNPPRNSREGKVFGTLGLEVPSAALNNISEAAFMTGTSVATVIAAGIAGMLLGYVNGKSGTSAYFKVKESLRTREGMLDMFESMGTTSHDGGHVYVAPWNLFCDDDEPRWARFQAVAAKHN